MRGSRSSSVIVAVLVGSLATSACILKADGFTGGPGAADGGDVADGGSGGSTSGADGASLLGPGIDGGGTTSGGVAPDSGSAEPNLLVNGDFELGCAGWDVAFGFVSGASVAHSGTGSCKFCMDTNFEAILSRDATVTAKSGQTYAGEVWFEGASSVSSLEAAGYVGSTLQLTTSADSPDPTDGPTLVDATWERATTLVTLTQDVSAITFKFHLQQSGNPAAKGDVICFYVDDAVIRLDP